MAAKRLFGVGGGAAGPGVFVRPVVFGRLDRKKPRDHFKKKNSEGNRKLSISSLVFAPLAFDPPWESKSKVLERAGPQVPACGSPGLLRVRVSGEPADSGTARQGPLKQSFFESCKNLATSEKKKLHRVPIKRTQNKRTQDPRKRTKNQKHRK